MVNSATGVGASASMRTTTSTGPDSCTPATENTAPSAIDQGSGLRQRAAQRAQRRRARTVARAALVRLREWRCTASW